MENISATPRQLWALYCITKKDYRNENLTKEEAASLIKKLGDPNYKKTSKKSIDEQLLAYLKEHINEIYDACTAELGIKSIVEDDNHIPEKDRKRYAFVGSGCGITYLRYRKNNKKAEEIDKAANKFHFNEIRQMLIDKLPKKEYKRLESIGCPFEAVWSQSQQLQLVYYRLVKKFAETKGVKFEIVSHLD